MSLRELGLGPSLRLVFEDRQGLPERLLAWLAPQPVNCHSEQPGPSYLAELEHRVYAEVEGHDRSFASPEANPDPDTDDPTSPRNFLRFEFSAAQIGALHAGADFGFGIDDDRMRVGAMVKREMRALLLADLE